MPDTLTTAERSARMGRVWGQDLANLAKLEALGWRVLLVWECELRDRERLGNTLRRFMEGDT